MNIRLEAVGLGHLNLDPAAGNLSLNDSGQSAKRHSGLGDNSREVGESCRTAGAVAAHLRFTGIGVEEAPFEVHLGIAFDQNHPVGADGKLAAAGLANEILAMIRVEKAFPVVDEYEIVAGPGHLKERNPSVPSYAS